MRGQWLHNLTNDYLNIPLRYISWNLWKHLKDSIGFQWIIPWNLCWIFFAWVTEIVRTRPAVNECNYIQHHLSLLTEAVARRCSVKKVFLEISLNSQENTCARVSFLIMLQASGLRPATLLKKRLWHRCFPVNFAKFLRTSFFIEHLWWLLLYWHGSYIHQIYLVTPLHNFGDYRRVFLKYFSQRITTSYTSLTTSATKGWNGQRRLRRCLHEIWFRAKLNIFMSLSGQLLITVYMIQPKWNVLQGSFQVIKYHVNTIRNEIMLKETSVHAFILSKQIWSAVTE